MVLRAREENIVKDFLPFFMQSDAFFEVALSISVGSLSPTINWKTLAEQKFTIPPKDEQKRIAEILWAADTTIRNYLEAKDEQTKVKWILFDELFLKPNNAKTLPLRMCMKERSESAKAPFSNEKYLALEHIESGESEIKLFANSKNVSSVCSVFKKGDLLYGKLRPYLDKAAISSDEGICSTEILVLEPIKEVTTANFLIHHFHSPDFIKHNVHQSYGTKMPRTSFKIVGDYPIQMPSLSEQKDILHKMQCFEDSQKALNENLTSLEVLKKQLIKNLIEV
jgi:type I restriction enzyme S subunit